MSYRVAPRWLGALALALVSVVLSGCGGNPSASGGVTFNGEPVADGMIIFSSESEANNKATGKVIGGKFAIPGGGDLLAGRNRIEIFWVKKTGKQITTPGDAGTSIDETVQVIPAQFNRYSTLKEEVKSGSNTFTFDLKGKANVPGQDKMPSSSERRRK
jgi:hypothetical protein